MKKWRGSEQVMSYISPLWLSDHMSSHSLTRVVPTLQGRKVNQLHIYNERSIHPHGLEGTL